MDDAIRAGLDGWTEEPTREVSLRLVHEQPGGGRLVAETGRPARAGLWLWVLDRPEARAFLIEADELGPALEVLQAQRDAMTVASYFGGYGALQKVAKVSILAYEQFAGVKPPFAGMPSVPPPAGGSGAGGSGWGNSSGNKSW